MTKDLAKVKRTTCRRKLTELINKSNDTLDSLDLEVLLERTTAALNNLREAQLEFEGAFGESISEEEYEATLTYEDNAVAFVAKVKLSINDKVSEVPVVSRTEAPSHAILPKVELKRFSGDHREWTEFWECFK